MPKKGREMSAFTEEEEEFVPSTVLVEFSEDRNYPLQPNGFFPIAFNILKNGYKLQYPSSPPYHVEDDYYIRDFMNVSVLKDAKIYLRNNVLLVSVDKMKKMLSLVDTTTQRKYEKMVLEKFQRLSPRDRKKKRWAPKTEWFGEW